MQPRPSTNATSSERGEVRARPWQAAGAGALLAAVIILASSHGHVRDMTTGDGLIYRYVASHLATDPGDIDPVVRERGTSLRYGRIGLPAVLYVVSAGRPTLMRYTQPIVMIASAAAASAAASLLFPGAGALAALLPFLAPGFIVALAGGFAEALAVASALWAVRFALQRRWSACALALSAALLTRENAVAVLLGIGAWAILRRTPRAWTWLAVSVVPVAAWYAFVRSRYGSIPPFDPYLRVATDTVGAPGVAIVRSFTDAVSVRAAVAAALHVAIGAAGVALAAVKRRSIYAFIAAFAAVQVLASGPFAWIFVGEAARTGAFLQLFVVLAVLAWRRPAWAAGDASA